MLGVLASYNLTVRELKLFFSKLQGEKGRWVKENKPETIFVVLLVFFCSVSNLRLFDNLKIRIFKIYQEIKDACCCYINGIFFYLKAIKVCRVEQ